MGPRTIFFMHNRGWLAVRGVVAILFGLIALFNPLSTFASLLMLFGIFLVIDGIAALISGLSHHQPGGMWLADGILGVLAGLVCLFMPLAASVALVYLWAAWALITGVLEVVAGARLHAEYRHGWMLSLAGIVSICLGVVFFLMPAATVVALTWCLAVYALVFGGSMLWLSIQLRQLEVATTSDLPSARAGVQPTLEEHE
ncbi:MAG TPA: HdeD family acid-resistance protein, partial [Candidatus Xenobia bacterium]